MALDSLIKRQAAAVWPEPVSRRAHEQVERGRGWFWILSALGGSNYRQVFYVTLGTLLGLFLLVSTHGPCLQLSWAHDDIVYLDNGWKVRNGLLPHVDFPCALGALYVWVIAAGMWLLGPTADVLPFCNAAVALVIGLTAWMVASRRLPAWPAAIFALTQALVAVAPHLLRDTWLAVTYAGYYNRQGYALVSILMLALFAPELGGNRSLDARRTGRLVGALLAVLFFLKISYFLVGLGLCATAFVCARRWSWELGKNLLGAFTLFGAVCLPLIGFNLVALLRDLHMASAARRAAVPGAAFSLQRFLGEGPSLWVETTLLVALQVALGPPRFLRRKGEETPFAPAWTELGGMG